MNCVTCGQPTVQPFHGPECEQQAERSRGLWYYDHEIIGIEYYKRRPNSVLTLEHGKDHNGKPYRALITLDFDYCRRDHTVYYHQSGYGGDIRFHVSKFANPSPPPAELWVAIGVPVVRTVWEGGYDWREVEVSDADLLSMGYKRRKTPRGNPFEGAVEGTTEYCAVCNDHLPNTYDERLCAHKRWCDDCGMWTYNKRSYKGIDQSDLCPCVQRKRAKS